MNQKNQKKKTHYKKLTQPFFDDVWGGKKKFELRKNDCDYQVGDKIVLKEYDPKHDEYIGRSMSAHIIYILKDYVGLEKGYCILGLGEIEKRNL